MLAYISSSCWLQTNSLNIIIDNFLNIMFQWIQFKVNRFSSGQFQITKLLNKSISKHKHNILGFIKEFHKGLYFEF